MWFRLPRDGDVAKSMTITDCAACRIKLLIGGMEVWSRMSGEGDVTIPLNINMLRIGYHSAIVETSHCDSSKTLRPTVCVTYILYDDIRDRRWLATTTHLGIPWFEAPEKITREPTTETNGATAEEDLACTEVHRDKAITTL